MNTSKANSGTGFRVQARRFGWGLLLLLCLGVTINCGKKGGGTTVVTSKDLFSRWDMVSPSTGFVVYLEGMAFGTNPAFMEYAGGSACLLDIIILGSQSSGTWQFSNSTWNGVGSDPGCADSSGVYSKTADTLSICDPDGVSNCGTYK